jgi:hypothetical protein
MDPNNVLIRSRRYRLATVLPLTYGSKYPHILDHNQQMKKIKTITIPLQGLSVDDFSTQDTHSEQIYLLLHIIESRL